MMVRTLKLVAAAGLLTLAANASPAKAADAICYNCPPQWADWASQLKAIQENLGINVPHDNKNSGQTLSQLLAEKNNPVADVAYYGVSFGIAAKEKGVVAPYKPAHWDDIPEGLKDPDGNWFTIHSGTLGLFVNKDALGGAPVPKSWKDLLKPEYKGMVGYLDPSSAFVGYAGAVAVNRALGGTLDDFTPAIEYFKELAKNDPIVPKQTSYARVLSGEIPILFDYDFNAYRAKYKDKAPVEFVIPQEGSQQLPYVMGLDRQLQAQLALQAPQEQQQTRRRFPWASCPERRRRQTRPPRRLTRNVLGFQKKVHRTVARRWSPSARRARESRD